MRTALIVIAVALAVLPMHARAQYGNPGGLAPNVPEAEPGKPAPDQVNTQDRLFVQLLGAGGLAEVDAGKLAESRGGSAEVKAFARRMAEEHAAANSKLSGAARVAAVPVPKDLDPEHKAMRAHLNALNGAPFDLAYMQGQLTEHQKTAHLLEWEISNGQNAQLRQFAMDTLPHVLDHLASAQRLLAELQGSPRQGLAAEAPSKTARADHPAH